MGRTKREVAEQDAGEDEHQAVVDDLRPHPRPEPCQLTRQTQDRLRRGGGSGSGGRRGRDSGGGGRRGGRGGQGLQDDVAAGRDH